MFSRVSLHFLAFILTITRPKVGYAAKSHLSSQEIIKAAEQSASRPEKLANGLKTQSIEAAEPNARSARQPRFKGTSYMSLPRLPRSARTSFELSIMFKASSGDGLLLYGGRKDKRKDFLALGLRNGHVEFRFSCGADIAQVRSRQNITLNQWHNVVVFRDKRDAHLMVDNGDLVTQSLKGTQSMMDLKTRLFLGGVPRMRRVTSDAVPYHSGFTGCVKSFVVDGRMLDLSQALGDVVKSRQVEECGESRDCECHHNAPCHYAVSGEPICACPLGTYGRLCEHDFKLVMPSFSGQSYLTYPSFGQSTLRTFTISLVLKPRSDTGLILFNSQKKHGKTDFISLSLREGIVEFIFDCGSGPAVIRSSAPIMADIWHTIVISRDGRTGGLSLDGGPPVVGTSPGRMSLISLEQEVYLGGMADYKQQPAIVDMPHGFNGCIQEVKVNSRELHLPSARSGLNVLNCDHICVTHLLCFNGGTCQAKMDHYKCHCAVGYTGMMCERARRVSAPTFAGDGFMKFKGSEILSRLSGKNTELEFLFRTQESSGLLLSVQKESVSHGDHITIGLIDGILEVRYDLGAGRETVIRSTATLDDGYWHSVKFVRKSLAAYLKVDDEIKAGIASDSQYRQLNSDVLFIGGAPTVDRRFMSGLVGCLKDLIVGDVPVDLASEVTSGQNVRPCSAY
ncbi:pikachurin [Nematostella vectensis]|uniref:pikachurin n=1 Tax=Nematostella vectensis TaxID=45351 RepID=UPI0020775F34|nr:pikachurin [Nematostella vectensis]